MASIGELSAKADALRTLHHGEVPLVLPNAWDVASARVFTDAGFPAIATTSGGVAAALGYPDGEVIPLGEMFDAVSRIARAVEVPVTADLESGYGLPPEDLIAFMMEAGVVGMNFEDTDHGTGAMRPATEQAARIQATKEAGRAAGADMVLNARVDVYLRTKETQPADQLTEALDRGRAYAGAGADCVFPIFCREPGAIGTLVRETGAPINILAVEGTPAFDGLRALGVARITFGSGLMRATMARTSEIAAGLRSGRFPWE